MHMVYTANCPNQLWDDTACEGQRLSTYYSAYAAASLWPWPWWLPGGTAVAHSSMSLLGNVKHQWLVNARPRVGQGCRYRMNHEMYMWACEVTEPYSWTVVALSEVACIIILIPEVLDIGDSAVEKRTSSWRQEGHCYDPLFSFPFTYASHLYLT